MKSEGEPLTWVTAYGYPTGYVAEKAEIDMILVGDSGGTVQPGYRSTNSVTMEEMLVFAKAARRGEAGILCLLLEEMPPEPAGQIAKQLDIPVYGIGAGNLVDGQLIIIHNLLGFYPTFEPKFAKCYIPGI